MRAFWLSGDICRQNCFALGRFVALHAAMNASPIACASDLHFSASSNCLTACACAPRASLLIPACTSGSGSHAAAFPVQCASSPCDAQNCFLHVRSLGSRSVEEQSVVHASWRTSSAALLLCMAA